MNSVRHNPLAIAVATIAYFLLGAVWFTVFQTAWLAGIGRTMQELMATGSNPFLGYAIALVGTFILALFLSVLTWMCVVFTTWSTEYAFEARSLKILAINTGYCLTGMVLMGAILGAWKKKT